MTEERTCMICGAPLAPLDGKRGLFCTDPNSEPHVKNRRRYRDLAIKADSRRKL